MVNKTKGVQAIKAYPNGWTCVSCGDEYTEKTMDAKDFYAIDTKHGTECLSCVDDTFMEVE